ncbi:MAG: ATP-binding protein [Bacillota bacterium]
MEEKYANDMIVDAKYSKQIIEEYKDNPLIEALPYILSNNEIKIKMQYYPYYDVKEKLLPTELRLHCVNKLKDLIIPMNAHFEVEHRISRLIRHGYINRHPLKPDHTELINSISQAVSLKDIRYIERIRPKISSASAFTIIGISGIGKTTMIERILQMYPHIIRHTDYKGHKFLLNQITYLKLECPFDGSVKGLCFNFFQAIDQLMGTNYYTQYSTRSCTTDQMIPLMAQIACLYQVGVLVIDEIQNLSEAKSGGASKMLRFFVQLINSINVPVILIGTPKAMRLFTDEFRYGRRGSGQQGDFIWKRMENDKCWYMFMEELWKYQWLHNECQLTDEIRNVMYEESQGITDIAIKLYMMTQWRAIERKMNVIKPSLIRSVAKDHLKLVSHALNALKSGNKKRIESIEDISFPNAIYGEFEMNANKDYVEQLKVQNIFQEKKEKKLTETIVEWLIEAGISTELSINVANDIINAHGTNSDLKTLRKEAFVLAMQYDQRNIDIAKCAEKEKLHKDTTNKNKTKYNSTSDAFDVKAHIKPADELL